MAEQSWRPGPRGVRARRARARDGAPRSASALLRPARSGPARRPRAAAADARPPRARARGAGPRAGGRRAARSPSNSSSSTPRSARRLARAVSRAIAASDGRRVGPRPRGGAPQLAGALREARRRPGSTTRISSTWSRALLAHALERGGHLDAAQRRCRGAGITDRDHVRRRRLARRPLGRQQTAAHRYHALDLRRRHADRLAGQQPRPVVAARQLALARELAERRRDRRASRADELAEHAVRQRHGQSDAVRGHPAPALGEMPEQREQPPVDAVELGDRLRDGEAQGALVDAVDDRRADLRVAAELGAQPAVQQREAAAREHVPADRVPEQAASCPAIRQGRTTSPGPSSSVLTVSDTSTSRAITPSSTSSPTCSALAPGQAVDVPRSRLEGSHDDAKLALGRGAGAPPEGAGRGRDRARAAVSCGGPSTTRLRLPGHGTDSSPLPSAGLGTSVTGPSAVKPLWSDG